MRTVARVSARLVSLAAWALLAGSVAMLMALGIGPRTGRYRTVTVLTASMRPGMPEGSVAVITPERPDQVRVGQVVTYQVPVGDRRIVSHRVVAVVEGEGTAHPVIQTQGDANNAPDPWLARIDDPTVWRARFAVPGLGRLISRVRSPLLHTVTVRLVPAVLALVWVVAIWREEEGPHPAGPEEVAA